MTNDSSTGGILNSYQDSYIALPLEGQALLDFFHDQFQLIAGIADPTLVRPRWQPEPLNLPAPNIDWLAFGLQDDVGDTNPAVLHETPRFDELPRTFDHINPVTGQPDSLDPPDFDIVLNNIEFTMMCSAYGPNADRTINYLRDGYAVAQNREPLQKNAIGFVRAGRKTTVPTKVNNKWYFRVDIPLMFRQHIRRVYPVLDIKTAQGSVNTDSPPSTRPITVTPKA